MGKKAFLQNALLVIFSVGLCYSVLEIGFRYFLYHQISRTLVGSLYQTARESADHPVAEFDPGAGYRYAPNKTWVNTGGYQTNSWRTNEHGLIANDIDRSNYPVEKSADEFRIALFGDSFTASNAVYLRWADLLQDYLNRSPDWHSFTGHKFTRVLNFGMDGTGVGQWAAVYRFLAHRFSPDMVIVNVFIDDVMRQFVYRGRMSFASESEMRAFIEENVREAIARMPWLGVYPELFAATIGRVIGMSRRLAPTTAIASQRFATQEEGVTASVGSLKALQCLNARMIVLHNPALEELLNPVDNKGRWPSTPGLVGLQTKFQRAAAAAGIEVVELESAICCRRAPSRSRSSITGRLTRT